MDTDNLMKEFESKKKKRQEFLKNLSYTISLYDFIGDKISSSKIIVIKKLVEERFLTIEKANTFLKKNGLI